VHVEVTDENPALDGTAFFDLRVQAPLRDWAAFSEQVHVCIGDNRVRQRMGREAVRNNKTLVTVIHPAAVVSRLAEVGAGTFLAAGAIIAPAAIVGTGAIINHGAVVDHDCRVGAYAHVAPNATLGGCARVGEGTLIGAGAVILPRVCVGRGCVIGAGAVVTRDIEDGQTVVGVPARPMSTTANL
jgi:sugar O-acyltransferase (sialic acid O-acetyltransferase NeuD family)